MVPRKWRECDGSLVISKGAESVHQTIQCSLLRYDHLSQNDASHHHNWLRILSYASHEWKSSVIYWLIFINVVTVYVVMFNKAYLITKSSEDLKKEILRQCRSLRRKSEVQKSIEGISRLEIKCGGFYAVERESTLIFVDFSSQQIISLLLTF